MKKIIISMFSFLFFMALIVLPVHAASMVVNVSPTNMHGWDFTTDDKAAGTADMTMGPGTPPLGVGSAHFVLSDVNQAEALALYNEYNGLALADINALGYSTYQTTSAPQAVSLQMNMDYDGAGGNDAFQGRLVYEPYVNGTPTATTWQEWDALDSGNALWWMTRAPDGVTNPCPQSTPCTWAHVKELYPNARLNNTYAGILLKAGSGWTTFNGNTDALRIGITNSTDITFNFEPTVPAPTDKAQCKNGGWMTFNNPTFKNQGQCVSYTNR